MSNVVQIDFTVAAITLVPLKLPGVMCPIPPSTEFMYSATALLIAVPLSAFANSKHFPCSSFTPRIYFWYASFAYSSGAMSWKS